MSMGMSTKRERGTFNDHSILELDWYWCELIPHMLKVDVDYEQEISDHEKSFLFGSHGISESTIFNGSFRDYFVNEIHNNSFLEFRHIVEIAFPENREPMLCEHLETKLLLLFRNLKEITQVFLLLNKNISVMFKQALSYEWQTSKDSILQEMVQLMDSYYGVLKWGPYWTINMDEYFTEKIFPNIVHDIRNRIIDNLVLDSFNRTHAFECDLEVLEEYNKDILLLRSRKKYICDKRPQILNTFQIYPWDMIDEPQIKLRAIVENRRVCLRILQTNWDSVKGLKTMCYVEFE